jgi:thioredoxin reductase (NADPH)
LHLLDMSMIDSRRAQMFPKLMPHEIDRLRRFGEVRHYAAGEALFVTGDIAPGMYVLIKGSVRVTRRDPLAHSAPIVEQEPGVFVAEVGQLSGQPAFVDVHAADDVDALLISRALMIVEPELGERIIQALILRRVALIEAGAGGPVLIGPEGSPDVVRLQASWPAMLTRINCSILQRIRTRRSWSSNMLQIRRTCRWRRVPGGRF